MFYFRNEQYLVALWVSLSLCDFWIFFHPPEIGRTKTTDNTFEEKIGVLFRFNAGNYFYELKKVVANFPQGY